MVDCHIKNHAHILPMSAGTQIGLGGKPKAVRGGTLNGLVREEQERARGAIDKTNRNRIAGEEPEFFF